MSTTQDAKAKHRVLLQRIHAAFPDLKWSTYRFIDVGWDHDVIVLDEKIVFRFPGDEHYGKLLASEIKVLSRLQPLVKVSIPQYKYVAPDGSFAGYPMIPGKTLFKDYFDTLSAADKSDIALQIADFLTTLHTSHGFEKDLPGSYMAKDQVEVREIAKKYLPRALSPADAKTAEIMLDDIDAVLAEQHPVVFIHGDLHPGNLLVKDDRISAVIDFGSCGVGDPAADLMFAWTVLDSKSREVFRSIVKPDDASWARGRGWAFTMGTVAYPYYRKTNPVFAAVAKRAMDETLADF